MQLERDRRRRRAALRSTLVAATSTVVVLVALIVAVVSSPGWDRVQSSFLDPAAARDALPYVAKGLWLNVRVMAVCSVVILALGMLIAVLRTLRGPVFFPVRMLAAAYTDLFRGLPLILLLLLMGFAVPGLRLQGIPTNVAFLGGAALVLTYSAYVAEVFRAGIETVHPSQRAAARSLGLSYAQTLRFIVLPQAVRRVVPPLLNDVVSLQKDSGLISILGAIDAIRAAQIKSAELANFTPYVVAGGLFVLITIPLTRLTDMLAMRAVRRQSQGGTT